MAQVDPGKLRPGMKVVIDGDLYIVQSFDLRTPGNLRSFVRSKMKKVSDGRVTEMTFRGASNIEEADYGTRTCQFLYSDGEDFTFMDLQTFEQFSVTADFLGIQAQFLIPEAEVIVAFWNDQPVGIELPPKMTFTVTDTIGDITRGNTANTITKEATIETGFKLQVPTFVRIGDKIRVSTEDGSYVERA
ncbi:MAG: elongation factor P [Candidatus Sumerlaeia bacterium]|nr:elongation factor P [Candidatus Sumerlaeia bacterium]